jgi:tyrosine-protein kinase Etk/Wzc
MATDTATGEKQARVPSSAGTHASGVQRREVDEISLIEVLTALAERKLIVIWTAGIFAILAVIVSLILPKSYTATVTLLPPQQSSSVGAALTSQLGNLGGMAALAGGTLGLKNPNDMYVAMLRSRTVEDAMVNKFGLMKEFHQRYLSDARTAFEARAKVDGTAKDGLIHITVVDGDPNRAAELANGYVDQFRNMSEHLAITEASQRRLFFERQLEPAKNNLADAEKSLKETEQKTGLIQLDSQARVLIETAASMRAQIAAKEVELGAMQTYATSENAQFLETQQELVGLRAQLAKLGGSEQTSEANLTVSKGKVTEAGLEYVRKMRDVKYYETIFDILARQFEMAKLDEAKQGAVIQVMDAAVPPDRRSSPKRAVIVIGATAAGFFVGIFVALVTAGYEKMRGDSETDRKLGLLRNALFFRKSASSGSSADI